MKLLIKQRVFSWSDTYDIYDEDGKPKYFVKAEFFRQPLTLKLMGRPLGVLKSSLLFSSPNTIWTIMDGAAKGIFCPGTTMCIPAAAWWFTFPRNRSTGEILMSLTL